MKALSIRQPFAWLIANNLKNVENRKWGSNFRGAVLIHASKTFDMEGYGWIKANMPMLCNRIKFPAPGDYEFGGIVGQVDITDCVTTHPSPWFFGPKAFVLANAKPLPFFPCKGALRFFDIPYPKGGAMAQPKQDKAPAGPKASAKPAIFCFSTGSKRADEGAKAILFTGQALALDGTVLVEGEAPDLEGLKKATGYAGDDKIPVFRAHYPREQYPKGFDLIWVPPGRTGSNKGLQAALDRRDNAGQDAAKKLADEQKEKERQAALAKAKGEQPAAAEPAAEQPAGPSATDALISARAAYSPETIMLTVNDALDVEEKAELADELSEKLEEYDDLDAEAKKSAKRYRDNLATLHGELSALGKKVNRGGRIEVECRIEERVDGAVPVRLDTGEVVEASEEEIRMAFQKARTVDEGGESGLSRPDGGAEGENGGQEGQPGEEGGDQPAETPAGGGAENGAESAPLEVAVREGEETI